MFKKRMRYILLITIIVAIMMSVSYADKIAYFPPYPKDINVLITKPEISMQLKLNNNTIDSLEMKVDGKVVKASYDKTREMVHYKPIKPLSEGQHTVDLTVNISGWRNSFSQSWNFTVSNKAFNNYPSISENQLKALRYVNQFRLEMGLPMMHISQALNAAANAHNNYMEKNTITSHNELPVNEGYSGGTPFIRAKAYGYNGVATTENVSSGFENQEKALQAFIDAPYHRLAWINPYVVDFGYAGQSDYHTVLFGTLSKGEGKDVHYPYHNQTQVPVSWENTETPNPIRGIDDNRLGYPITVSYFSEKDVTEIEVRNITLKDESQTKKDFYIKQPSGDEYLTNSIIIIPKNPLRNNTKYTVSYEFLIDFSDGSSKTKVNRTFNFTTVGLKTFVFNDISEHWAVENIEKLAKEGIIDKGKQTSFYPDVDITRSDFCLYIVKLLGLDTKPLKGEFRDVTSTTSNAKYIEAAKNYGIIFGYPVPEGIFKPNDKISRQEIAVIIKRAYDIKKGKSNVSDYALRFLDNDKIKPWARDGVKLCNKLGIIKGRPGGDFDPYNYATRAEAVTIMTRLQKLLD